MVIENPDRNSHTHVCDRCFAQEEHLPQKCCCYYLRVNDYPTHFQTEDFSRKVSTTEYRGWRCPNCDWDTSRIGLIEKEIEK